MMKEEIIKNVPNDQIHEIVKDFESEGAKVKIETQANGMSTLRALFLKKEERHTSS